MSRRRLPAELCDRHPAMVCRVARTSSRSRSRPRLPHSSTRVWKSLSVPPDARKAEHRALADLVRDGLCGPPEVARDLARGVLGREATEGAHHLDAEVEGPLFSRVERRIFGDAETQVRADVEDHAARADHLVREH